MGKISEADSQKEDEDNLETMFLEILDENYHKKNKKEKVEEKKVEANNTIKESNSKHSNNHTNVHNPETKISNQENKNREDSEEDELDKELNKLNNLSIVEEVNQIYENSKLNQSNDEILYKEGADLFNQNANKHIDNIKANEQKNNDNELDNINQIKNNIPKRERNLFSRPGEKNDKMKLSIKQMMLSDFNHISKTVSSFLSNSSVNKSLSERLFIQINSSKGIRNMTYVNVLKDLELDEVNISQFSSQTKAINGYKLLINLVSQIVKRINVMLAMEYPTIASIIFYLTATSAYDQLLSNSLSLMKISIENVSKII